jgi:hypothetical protein
MDGMGDNSGLLGSVEDERLFYQVQHSRAWEPVCSCRTKRGPGGAVRQQAITPAVATLFGVQVELLESFFNRPHLQSYARVPLLTQMLTFPYRRSSSTTAIRLSRTATLFKLSVLLSALLRQMSCSATSGSGTLSPSLPGKQRGTYQRTWVVLCALETTWRTSGQ